MFSTKNNRRFYKFDPFNIANKKDKEIQGIKFERLSKTVKTKPLWWLIVVFVLVLLFYWYLNTKFM
jgi:hypothetical protein